MKPGLLASRRGVTMIELLHLVAVLGILLASGALVLARQRAQQADLEAYTQAVLIGQEALETRRATGHFPNADALERYRAAIGPQRAPAIQTREEGFRGAGLPQVTVTVSWRSEGVTGGQRRQVRLSSLVRPR